MSGPKRGTWTVVYDPKPDRLADLSDFASGLTAWLERNGGFIHRHLGEAALASAQAASDLVQQCIEDGVPDEGFDAYGDAWKLFHQLHGEAVDSKRREQARLRQEAEERERRRQQEQARRRQETALREQQRRQEELRRRQAAAEAVGQCQKAWQTPEHQMLLGRWTDARERRRLEADLRALDVGSPGQVLRKASAWQQELERVLRAAGLGAAANSQAVAAMAPQLRAALRALGELNTPVLAEAELKQLATRKRQLRRNAESALSGEELPALRDAIDGLRALAAEYAPKVRTAELTKASEAWREALVRCGYSVVARTGPDGGVILEAGSFPMRTLNVEVRADSPEVKLEVSGKHDHARCVKDVQSLQAELALRGVQLTMTDWGAAKPGSAQNRLAERLSLGGGK